MVKLILKIGVIGFTHFLDPWVHWPYCMKFDIQSIVRYKKELYFGSIYDIYDKINGSLMIQIQTT